MTKNLYRVVDTKTKSVVQEGFEKKEDAKAVRNEHNEKSKDKTEKDVKPRYVVARCTDHPHGATDGFDHKLKKKFG